MQKKKNYFYVQTLNAKTNLNMKFRTFRELVFQESQFQNSTNYFPSKFKGLISVLILNSLNNYFICFIDVCIYNVIFKYK